MKRNITGKSIIHLVALAMLTAFSAQAATYSWIGTTGNWNDVNNWDLGIIPTAVTGDITHIQNGGTAVIAVGDSAVSDKLLLGNSAGNVGHIVQNGGTLAVSGQFFVGGSGAGTYTLNGGLLDYNGLGFTLGRFGDATAGAASFYQKGGEVQTANIGLTRAGSLYEISGGTFTGGEWNRQDNTTIRVIGSAASINVTGFAFRNDTGGASLEFVLDNSANHISMATHTGSGLRRKGHLAAKLQGGVLLSGASQFSLVRSDSTMASYSWASTPGGLWTYSGNVLDSGKYYERITLAAAADAGDLDASIEKNYLNLTSSEYGYIDLTNVGSTLAIGLEFVDGFDGSELDAFKTGLTNAGINWTVGYGRYDIGLFLDPSVSGSSYFAWDLSDYTTLRLAGIANTIPEPSSLLLLGLAGFALMCRRR